MAGEVPVGAHEQEPAVWGVVSLLHHGRLLSLTGAGGSGKTRLALRAARQVVGEYPDGVWLIELAALADPALVGTSLAVALGVRERSGPLVEALKRRLRDWQVLVVLDKQVAARRVASSWKAGCGSPKSSGTSGAWGSDRATSDSRSSTRENASGPRSASPSGCGPKR